MKTILVTTIMAAGLAAAFAAPSLGQEGLDLIEGPTTFDIDPAHTTILLSWDHNGLSTSFAAIREFEGTLTLDPANLEASELSVTMQVDSLDTFWQARTDDLVSENFFNVAEFPTATFESTEIVLTGDTTADVTGDFTLLGVTTPLTLQVEFNSVTQQENRLLVGFDAEAAIQRADYGVTRFAPAVGGEVTIRVSSELAATI